MWPTTDIDVFTSPEYTDWEDIPSQGPGVFYADQTNRVYAGLDRIPEEDLRYEAHIFTELGNPEIDRSRDERMLAEEIETGGYKPLIDDNITVYLATLEAQVETMRNSEKYGN